MENVIKSYERNMLASIRDSPTGFEVSSLNSERIINYGMMDILKQLGDLQKR